MNPQRRDQAFDEEARLALAQVYELLLNLARENAGEEDASTDDLNGPESPDGAHNE